MIACTSTFPGQPRGFQKELKAGTENSNGEGEAGRIKKPETAVQG